MSKLPKVLHLVQELEFDEPYLAVLKDAGYQCYVGIDRKHLLKQLEAEEFDLLIIEWRNDDTTVWMLEQVREFLQWHGPILFIADKDDEEGLHQACAHHRDNFLTRPIQPNTLLSCANKLVQNARYTMHQDCFEFGPYQVSLGLKEISLKGKPINLTSKEFELGALFLRNPGRLYSRKFLLKKIWGIDCDISTRTVDAHISSLRKKLNIKGDGLYRIKTVYQHGYRLELLEETEAVA
ncbi:winged helix-turn-helix transcriptional regulator [Kangiella sp.]|uniref:winged helix-turn-helix transcriptional regulator n=1 Tax=Kangiella sp. TaxID=1920245 RepID=UPI003A8D8662